MSRRTHQTRRPLLETLEQRCTPSVTVVDVSGGAMRMYCNNNVSNTQVTQTDTTLFVRELTTGRTWEVARASVQQMLYFGGSSADTFTNVTAFRSVAHGYGGNDTFRGGTARDVLLGGTGNDRLEGREGNDSLYGEAGNDTLRGGEGCDVVSGGDGADTLYGEGGNDTVYGGAGNDLLHGGAGADRMYGQTGVDALLGQAGNDVLDGGDQDDGLYGGDGDDTLSGGITGNDWLKGGGGNDVLSGQSGDDSLFGESGNDSLCGGSGKDALHGDAGDDTLRGGNDRDWLYGGEGNDVLLGEHGNDSLYGGSEDDYLSGGLGTDVLVGDDGRDALFGGIDGSAYDVLYGVGGQDRFLVRNGYDYVRDLGSEDVKLRFTDGSSTWTEAEVRNVDQALAELHHRTGSTRILKDTDCQGPLNFVKERTIVQNGTSYAGMNSTWYELNGLSLVHKRKISIADWDETSDGANRSRRSTVIHEIGHNWDEASEAAHHPTEGDYLFAFMGLHAMSDEPNDFASSYGQTNAHEDWATCWEAATGYVNPPSPSSVLQAKLAVIDAFFEAFI